MPDTAVAASEAPRRLVFVTTGLETGGAEMMLLKLVSALPALGFTCTVVSLRDHGTIGPRIAEQGVQVDALELQQPWRLPATLRRVGALLRRLQPELLVGWMYHGNLAASLAALGFPEARVVWSIRQTLYDLAHERPLTRLVIRAGGRLAARPEVIIYNSIVSARQHRAEGYAARRDMVIPNGFDCDVFRPDPAAACRLRGLLGLAGGTPLIGLFARYHRMKDHSTFLRAAEHLVASGSAAHFICAGWGAEAGNPQLADEIGARGLAARMHLLGEVQDTAALLAGLDLLCSSSRSGEGFSNVLGEAMACGVPCAVTDVGDSAMIVGSTGVVVAPGDAAALARGCAALLAEPEAVRAERGAAARARIMTEFSLGRVAMQYAEVFRGILQRPPNLTQ